MSEPTEFDGLGPLATLIKVIEINASGHGDEALAALLSRTDNEHVPNDQGECEVCPMADDKWPCMEWFEALKVAVRWVALEAGGF